MIRNGREVLLGEAFIQELALTEKYVGRDVAVRGRRFVSDLTSFLFETLAPLPYAHPTYAHPTATGRKLRRAVFRKEYIVIYEVSDAVVVFVFFHHSSRSQPDLSFLDG